MVITMSLTHRFLLRLVVGKWTNMKAKLLVLWGLLLFSQNRHIHIGQILGDLKVIIEWENQIHLIHSLDLSHWLSRVNSLLKTSPEIYFHHIYKELNGVVDILSKKAIGTKEGFILYEEFMDETLVGYGKLKVYYILVTGSCSLIWV